MEEKDKSKSRFEEEMTRMMNLAILKLDGLETDVRELKTHVQELKTVQKEHSQILENHTKILSRLDAKTDDIAEKVLNHEVRLSKAEQSIEDLHGRVH